MASIDPISYCRVCKLREFSTQRGVLCSLTHEKPTWDDYCPDFVQDEKEASRLDEQTTPESVDDVFATLVHRAQKKALIGVVGGLVLLILGIWLCIDAWADFYRVGIGCGAVGFITLFYSLQRWETEWKARRKKKKE